MNMPVLILGTLNRIGPMHGYDLKKIFELSYVDEWAQVMVGSIYHALKHLEKQGFIEVKSIEKKGLKAKAIYQIKPSGKAELKKLLAELLSNPGSDFPASLYVCLTLIDELDLETAMASLTQSLQLLEARHQYWKEAQKLKNPKIPDPYLIKAIFENGINHMQADITMLHQVQQYLQKKTKED